MSVLDDSQLVRLKRDKANLEEGRTAIDKDLVTLRQKKDRDLQRIKDRFEADYNRMEQSYVREIESLERRREGMIRRMPDIDRQISVREDQLRREEQQKR